MAGIISMIENNEQNKKETVATTIRMTEEIASQIEGLVDYLETSKNEVMVNLLKTGLEQAYQYINTMDDDIIESEDNVIRYFLFNTNKGNNVADHARMMDEERIEAFSSPWKESIKKIKKDDIVFLYANGEGIVAYGKASGIVQNGYRYDDPKQDGSCYQELIDFKKLSKPIKASEIYKVLGKKVPFLKTLYILKHGEKLWKIIKK
ncbi:unnamed protein product [Commensalibacter communis]|uniref:EVE domain-containing protein n=1 Tax=Commensalibacter communis TaxID=2972786 RepID=A0A9W4TPZ8_9PROT|nr:hypothetical protein [Commensalibacter communis]CAI3933042.1 unnamed protein product [Commensalibacter communis]CAI3942776.1 unnamed protein product [Commensalibacter communis]CAI3951786.1 unnamed protein product [Commensalibacter communis]CAI3953393.1 unnamed protein product [Commensalibacter communis]CAI3960572.1 unnamed protein product [Commensalibacter communis]